jgi:uncharacterized protein YjbI with pentapeptide repeats
VLGPHHRLPRPRARLRRLRQKRADLFRADLNDANLAQPQLDEACGTDVKLPPELSDKNLKPCRSD